MVFLGFEDSWFIGFSVPRFWVSWFQRFLVSKFQRFKIYQMSISCVLENIGPISDIFKNLLNGSSGLFGARLFMFSNFLVSDFLKIIHIRMIWAFLELFDVSWCLEK